LPTAQLKLNEVATALTEQDPDSTMVVEGHTDSQGKPDFNQKLSQARAQSVRDYLVQNVNIDKSRLEAVGKGDRELMNKTNVDAPENRRVTIVNLSR